MRAVGLGVVVLLLAGCPGGDDDGSGDDNDGDGSDGPGADAAPTSDASVPGPPDAAVLCQPGEITTLGASDRAAHDRFASRAAIDGDTAIVGAHEADSGGMPGMYAGAAYVFERAGAGGAWAETAAIRPADRSADAQFGKAVDIDGDHAIVGAAGQLAPGGQQFGAVYFLSRADGWAAGAPTVSSDAQVGDIFGFSVAISGTTAVVGALLEAGGAGNPLAGSGAVYVFERDAGGTWSEVDVLRASDAKAGDGFGYAVALDGDRLAVSSRILSAPPAVGTVYVFERSGGTWSEVDILTASDGVPGDDFAVDLALSGDRLVVGARLQDVPGPTPEPDHGAAYVFERDGAGAWAEVAKLSGGDTNSGDAFGWDVAIDGDRVVVTAIGKEGPLPNDINFGRVYFFTRGPGGAWSELGIANQPMPEPDPGFGVAVATSGGTTLVGASGYASAGTPLAKAGAAFFLACP